LPPQRPGAAGTARSTSTRRGAHVLHVYLHLEVVEMHTWSSDWKRVIIFIVVIFTPLACATHLCPHKVMAPLALEGEHTPEEHVCHTVV
jgi:hypothetical protein